MLEPDPADPVEPADSPVPADTESADRRPGAEPAAAAPEDVPEPSRRPVDIMRTDAAVRSGSLGGSAIR